MLFLLTAAARHATSLPLAYLIFKIPLTLSNRQEAEVEVVVEDKIDSS